MPRGRVSENVLVSIYLTGMIAVVYVTFAIVYVSGILFQNPALAIGVIVVAAVGALFFILIMIFADSGGRR